MSSRSRRSRAEALSPALFPFLAVLVCTMGALVLILVIVVSQASASAKLSLQAEEDSLLEASDLVEVASEEMKAQRLKQQEAIDNRRSQLAAIEDHISRLMEELKSLEQTAQSLQQQSTQTEQQRAEQTQRVAVLEMQLREEQEKLDQARSKAENSTPAFAILPYQGSRGTTRRPIYLECTQRGVIIQPEGVLISIEDLKPPHGPGNPLDASLRLIRSAYQRLDPTASSGVSPYPLLLVRPDGIKAYVLARAAMNGWDDQFGYELIDQAMPLAFPPSIPGMSKQLAENLDVARQRQMALIAAMPRRYGSESEWDEALDSIDRGVDEGNGGLGARSSGSSGNDWSAIDSEIGEANDRGSQGKWDMIAELPNSTGPGHANVAVAEIPDRYQPSFGYQGSMNSTGQASTAKVTRQDFQEMQQAAREGSLQSNGAMTRNDGQNVADVWQSPAVGAESSDDLGVASRSFEGNRSQAQKGDSSNTSAGASPLTRNQPLPFSQNSGSDSMASQGDPPSLSSQMQPGNQEMAQSVAPASERNPVERSPSVDISPRRSPPGQRASGSSKNAAGKSVRTWTTRNRSVNGTQVSRPITIVAMSDRWLVMRDDVPNQVERVISLQVGPGAASQQLEAAVNDRVESWGVAVAGGYWQPKLNVQFGPDSEMSVQRLQKILDGSGLETDLQPLR